MPAKKTPALKAAPKPKPMPACEIRRTEAGPVTMMSYAGVRQTGKQVFIAGCCTNPGGNFRVELKIGKADRETLAKLLAT